MRKLWLVIPALLLIPASGDSQALANKPYVSSACDDRFLRCDDTWQQVSVGSASLPSGAIVLILSGACPTGFTQETALNGKFILGTVAANADIGTMGGSDSITTVLNHTHPVTDPGHAHGLAEGTTDGSGTFMDRSNAAAATTAVTDSATTGVTTANPAGGVASIDNRPAFTRVIFCRAN